MRESSPSLSLPEPHEIRALTATIPALRFTRNDLEHYLRRLMQLYPASQLLVFQSVTLIETDCRTFARSAREGYVTILRLDDARLLLDLLGGPTGFESRYLDPVDITNEAAWTEGWSACAGTPGRWDACYVPGTALSETHILLCHALTHGPSITFPRPLTPEEQAARTALAKQRFIESLRQPPLVC